MLQKTVVQYICSFWQLVFKRLIIAYICSLWNTTMMLDLLQLFNESFYMVSLFVNWSIVLICIQHFLFVPYACVCILFILEMCEHLHIGTWSEVFDDIRLWHWWWGMQIMSKPFLYVYHHLDGVSLILMAKVCKFLPPPDRQWWCWCDDLISRKHLSLIDVFFFTKLQRHVLLFLVRSF